MSKYVVVVMSVFCFSSSFQLLFLISINDSCLQPLSLVISRWWFSWLRSTFIGCDSIVWRTFPPPTCLLSFKFCISMVSRIFLQLCRLNAFSVINFGAQIVSDVARGSCDLARLAPEVFWHAPSLLKHILLPGTRCSKLILNFLSASSEVNLLFKEPLENGISKSRYDRPRVLNQVARGCLSEEIACKWEERQWAMWVPGGRVHLAEERIEQNAEMGRSQVMFEEQQIV